MLYLDAMNSILRSFLAPRSLQEDYYAFTLDHDGGLVVSLDVLLESGELDQQYQGVRLLKDLEKRQHEISSLGQQLPIG